MLVSIISWIAFFGILNVNGRSGQGTPPCGSDEHLQHDLSEDPGMQGRMDAIEEHWRRNPNYGGHQIDLRRRLQALPSPLVIPINFIITKCASDPYIGYEQIISQIRVLNQDFQGLNSDKGQNGRGSVVNEFKEKAGDFNIRFSLNKIKRKDSSLSGFDKNGDDMKSDATGGQDNEDPEHALNFWVNSFLPGQDTLGFATFPGGAWNIDGVVQRPDVVGSDAYDRNNQWSLDSDYGLGRTASHEIGHWLNLRHIWGDGDCNYDDHVSDTPVDDGPNYGCAADGTSSCGSNDMYMNYMDYSHDDCLNMFTIGQVDRADDLFLAGGHREKLLDYVSNPTDVSFVDYFYFVNGYGAQCDNGHTRRDLDLNKGAGGDYIYLCISYSHNPYVDVITDIYILYGGSSGISCNAGYEKIDSELNEDAGGDYMYVCYKKESQETASTIITDLYPFAFSSAYSSSEYAGYTLELVDLNKAAGGDYIYLGYKKDHALETINFGEVKSGSITSYNKKYYKITLTEDEPIYFETCGSNYDTQIYFYDSNLNQIGFCDDCGNHGPSCGYQGDLDVSASAGTYYVGVGGYSSSSGSYQLSMAQGSLSCGGSSVSGDIVSYGKDYYRIDLSSSYQKIYIEACNSGTNYDTYLYLYNDNMDLMNSCDDCQDHNGQCIDGYQGDFTEDNIPAGTYFVGIGGYGSSHGNYELTLTCDTAIGGDVDFVKEIDNNNNNNPVYRYKNKYFVVELSNNDILIIIFVLLLLVIPLLCIITYKRCVGKRKNRYDPVKMVSDSEVDAESQEIANLN